jgi:hypothetical protein
MSKVLPYLWYPVLFSAAIAGFAALRASDVDLLLALYSSIVLAGLAIVALELVDPERADWRPRKTDVLTDAVYMLVTQIVTPRFLTLLGVVLVACISYDASTGPWPHQWPLAAQTMLMVLVVDFMRYWLHRACHSVPCLHTSLSAVRDTRIGRQYDFASITDEQTYRERVPVHDYEALRPYVDAEIDSAECSLTREAPAYYLKTSGTTRRAKDIPLTLTHLQGLRRTQRRSVAAQHRRHRAAFRGSILAIASSANEGRLANGRPFGSASGIVAGGFPALVRDKFLVPALVSGIIDAQAKYLLIARFALARRDLSHFGTANPILFSH